MKVEGDCRRRRRRMCGNVAFQVGESPDATTSVVEEYTILPVRSATCGILQQLALADEVVAVVVGGDNCAGGIELLDDLRIPTNSLATQITKSTKRSK